MATKVLPDPANPRITVIGLSTIRDFAIFCSSFNCTWNLMGLRVFFLFCVYFVCFLYGIVLCVYHHRQGMCVIFFCVYSCVFSNQQWPLRSIDNWCSPPLVREDPFLTFSVYFLREDKMIKWVWVVQAVRAWSFMNFMNGNSQQFDSKFNNV